MIEKSNKDSMADLLRAMGDGMGLGIADDGPVTPTRNGSYTQPGSIDPITGERVEFFGGEDMPADSMDNVSPYTAPRVPISSAEQGDMKNILRIFHENGGNDILGLAEEPARRTSILMEENPELSIAMRTERTSDGVRVGGWKITTDRKDRFDVISIESDQIIAKDLYIYEAAEALVKMLNEGMMINNMKVQNILLLEMDYAKHIEDAIQHKQTVTRALDRGDDQRMDIARTRFNESKTKALAARKKLVEHLSSRT